MYQVIKKIKGHAYLYNQETYRDNAGKVKTISHYIGPVDIVGGPASSRSATNEVNKTVLAVNEVVQKANSLEPSSEPKQVSSVQPPTPPKPLKKLTLQNNLTIRANLTNHSISQKALEAKNCSFLKQVQASGLDIEKFPKITIKNGGSTIKFKKSFGGDYTIVLPKKAQNGGRTEFQKTYQRVIANIYLDAIEQQKPSLFNGTIKPQMKQAFHDQNKAIVAYINHSNRKSGFKFGLTLHFLYSKMVSAWTQANLAPEKLGFADYSQRRNWREDTVLLMAEVQKEGWEPCYRKYMAELHKTERQIRYQIGQYKKLKFLDKLSGKARAKRRDIRRMNARRRAIYATCNKISILSNVYVCNPKDSFLHLTAWERTKAYWKKTSQSLKFLEKENFSV